MKLYVVTATTGVEKRTSKQARKEGGARTISDGLVSDKERCLAFKAEHEALGHKTSPLRRWNPKRARL